MLCLLPAAANIIILETHYKGTGDSATRISVETILSIGVIAIYAGILHELNPSYLIGI
ncbi:MAG: hypothetical protein KAH18_12560 [Psychromonas sp.]|nr:hypothetical protein [Psychromonas sp.]